MTMLEVRGLGVAWAASLPVLKEVSFVLTPGFYGLVGANGAGKTTLLRVLAGELAPHEGARLMRPAGATIVHCPQAVDDAGADVFALAASHDGVASELRGRLGLEADDLPRWPTLSPGERKRWQIGAALAQDPDVLLLDEPTNHLDGAARERLLGALARFRGIGVIVSHDRALLERLPRAILRVFEGAVTLYDGAWSAARATWQAERREREAAHAGAKAAVRTLERRLDSARRQQESAARSLGARSRMKNKNDHDARSMGSKVVAGWAEAGAGRSVELARRQLAKAQDSVPAVTRDVTLGGRIFASYERAPHAVLFHLEANELCAGDRVVLRDVRLDVGRDERLRIAGANGAGKTTLLAALMAAQRRSERVLFLPQELSPAAVARLTSDLRATSDAERGRVLSVFAALGSDPERILTRRAGDEASLSPGEARKLALATGLGRHAWALVLDEPTNHLDLPTLERLETALREYPGALVLVTHDDAFAAAVTTRTVVVEGGRAV
jgi:ATPase subunit of ABC transporter with duplicated ATPase domains